MNEKGKFERKVTKMEEKRKKMKWKYQDNQRLKSFGWRKSKD